jgi:hypothetical protein
MPPIAKGLMLNKDWYHPHLPVMCMYDVRWIGKISGKMHHCLGKKQKPLVIVRIIPLAVPIDSRSVEKLVLLNEINGEIARNFQAMNPA